MAYRFTIPGEVVHSPRPRVTRAGRGYMPPKYQNWKRYAVMILRGYPVDSFPVDPPLSIEIDFYFRRPNSRIRSFNRDLVLPRYAARGDLDNGIKSVLDALQDAGIIANDSGFWEIKARQWFCRVGDDPLIQIDLHGSVEY